MTTQADGGVAVMDEEEIEIELDLEDGDKKPGEGVSTPAGEAAAAPQDKRGADDNNEDNETPDQRRERLRRSSKEKRAHRREVATRDADVIAALTETVKSLGEQVGKIGGTVQQLSTNEAVKARDHFIGQAKRLRVERAKAIDNGEGERAIVLEDQYNRAVANANHYDQMIPDADETPQRTQQQPQQSADEAEMRRVAENNTRFFMGKFSWYDPKGGDKDSRLVQKLSQEVAAMGHHQASAAYWQTLEQKMEAQGLVAPDDVDDEPQPPRNEKGQFTSQARPAGGPPVGGRTEATSGNKVKIPKALKDSMIEAGLWDKPDARKRIVTAYFANKAKAAGK